MLRWCCCNVMCSLGLGALSVCCCCFFVLFFVIFFFVCFSFALITEKKPENFCFINWAEHNYSWLSLSRPHLSRITTYIEVKIWSLPKHVNLTTGKKYCGKEEKLFLIALLFHNIFNLSLTSRVKLHIYLLNVVVRIIFSLIMQIWYVEVRISWSIS